MAALVRSPEVPTPSPHSAGTRRGLQGGAFEQTAVALATGAVLAFSIVLRFWTPSPMWLDEALTVNIARAPLHLIPGLLRHDGAPPLYYVLLHFWMRVFGTSDLGARSLSGVIGVLTLPAAWLAGYRVGSQSWRSAGTAGAGTADARAGTGAAEGMSRDRTGPIAAWTVTLLVATSPFAVYYDTEARMYSLVILLSTLGVLAFVAILRRPTVWNALALAAVTCALEYSHYWALFLVATATLGSAVFARSGPHARSCRVALLALAAGTCAFGPWVPTFLFQLQHTGTPWASPADFTALVYTFTQFAGGDSDAGRALALVLAFLALLGVAGSALDGRRVVLDLRTRPGVRALASLAVGTLLVALIAGKLSGSTFADRYSAVILTPCLLVVAYGATMLADRRVRQGVVAVAVVFGLAASIPNAFLTRTQAAQVASAVLAGAHRGDVVAYCPDQLGPAVSRELDDRFDEVAFPRADPPEIVNWVDYAAVVDHASASAFVRLLESRAGSTEVIWYVWAPGYLNYGADCQAIANDLAASRPQQGVVAERASDTPFEIFEGENLYRYPPPS
ncbi:MAG: hypothetical protein ACLP36_02540 [Acidimicrobiales bacterium]